MYINVHTRHTRLYSYIIGLERAVFPDVIQRILDGHLARGDERLMLGTFKRVEPFFCWLATAGDKHMGPGRLRHLAPLAPSLRHHLGGCGGGGGGG